MMTKLEDQWVLAHFDANDSALIGPPPEGWRPAKVPGVVQTSAFGLPREQLYRGTRVTEVQWMQERLWVYRRAIQVPKLDAAETARIVFDGLDYYYEVRLDGVSAAKGEGMFHPVILSLDQFAGRSVEVEVRLLPPPLTKQGLAETTKAQFGRGWDFAPELRTIGIWNEVRLEIVPRLRVTEAFIETRLENKQRARVTVRAELSEKVESGWARITLAGRTRRVPLLDMNGFAAFLEVESPELWWPNGLGQATLHDLAIELEVPEKKTAAFHQRVGLREVARVPAEGQRETDTPLQFVINGVPFFICGVNWVPPDSCIGEIIAEQYDQFLNAFQASHVNLVRVWGGGLREKEHFYERCDELGLLVFQEYPIACGWGVTEDYHRQLAAEARQIARGLRRHPSVFLFSGGNENYHYWDMLKAPEMREHAEKAMIAVNDGRPFDHPEWLAGAVQRYDEPIHLILGGITAELAPHCLYQNTSPMEREGEVHGIWTWNPKIGDHRYRMYETLYDYWRAADQHLYSEASVSSIANRQTIEYVTGEKDGLPSPDDETWRMHHAFHGVWDKARDLWLDLPSTEKVFGPIKDLRELVVLNQYLQAEGGRFMIEELRRKQPRTTGVIWWGVNEPWPGLAGNALIDYFGHPKLSWPIVAKAFAPTILSLRYDALQPKILQSAFWLSCNDRKGFTGSYKVVVTRGDEEVLDTLEGECSAAYGESHPVRAINPFELPSPFVAITTALYNSSGELIHENSYWFGDIREKVLRSFGGA